MIGKLAFSCLPDGRREEFNRMNTAAIGRFVPVMTYCAPRMPKLPDDHAQRYALAAEVHARPPESLQAPARASYLALLVDPDARSRELEHVAALCARFAQPPPDGSTHFRAALGNLRLKWERHGEFSGYTFFADGAASAKPFAAPALSQVPEDWLARMPGATIVAAHAELLPAPAQPPDSAWLGELFDADSLVGCEIADRAALGFADFRIHHDGCARFLVLNRGLTPRQAGRILQRLFEIEAYRMLALLALPIARRQAPRILAIEQSLAHLTDGIARGDGDDEALLHELTRLAAEVESCLAASQFRFGACRAYHELVIKRIAELREQRLPGLQTIDEFMARRFAPAVNTCATVSQRLHDMSERVAQASGLLSTRVDIARERQNQALLASMNERAKMQFRLQQTVEGLSIAAIVYYVVGLLSYAVKAVKSAGTGRIESDVVVGAAIPFVAAVVYWAVHRARRRVGEPGDA